MKRISIISLIILLVFAISCSAPQSKDSYLEKFGNFIQEVQNEHLTYNDEDWNQSDLKFERFTGEWYDKFSDELVLSDEVTIKGYQAQYYLYKASDGTNDFFDEYLKDDFERLREDVKYYIENDMENDLQKLIEKAEEAGDTAVYILNEIIEDLKEK